MANDKCITPAVSGVTTWGDGPQPHDSCGLGVAGRVFRPPHPPPPPVVMQLSPFSALQCESLCLLDCNEWCFGRNASDRIQVSGNRATKANTRLATEKRVPHIITLPEFEQALDFCLFALEQKKQC